MGSCLSGYGFTYAATSAGMTEEWGFLARSELLFEVTRT